MSRILRRVGVHVWDQHMANEWIEQLVRNDADEICGEEE